MAKKKKGSKYRKHLIYHTRVGFYGLVGLAIIASIGMINLSGNSETKSVLGKSDDSSGSSNDNREDDNSGSNNNNNGDEDENKDDSDDDRARDEERKEDIEQKFRIETDDLKLEIKAEGNKIERKIKIKNEDSDLDDEDENELEDEIEQEFEEEHEIEIASEDGELVFKKDKTKTKIRTGFPLSIDVATNQLIITRPDGSTKAAAILPDKAVENFTRHKKMNFIGESTGTGSAGLETSVSLVARDGEAVYEIKGKKKLKVLGFIPFNATTTGYVSMETGEVIDEKESFFTNILDLLSP